MLRLYDNLSSGNGHKVRMLLRRLGVPFERVELDIYHGASRTPDYLARNPNGRIPMLEFEDGRLLPESNAILWHFAEGTPWLPDDRFTRAQVLQWLFFEQNNHEPSVAMARAMVLHPPPGGVHPAVLEDRRRRGVQALETMERHLAGRTHFVGDRETIADLALYAYTAVAGEGGLDLAGVPGVRAWLDRIAAHPAHVGITFDAGWDQPARTQADAHVGETP